MTLDFLIIGAQKSATSFLHHCIADHPDIYMPPHEVPFFEDPDYARHGFSDLMRLFDVAKEHQKLGLKRPSYLAQPESPRRIHRHMPEGRLIVSLRNPIDRAVSSFFHQMRHGMLPFISVEEGFERLLAGDFKDRHPRSSQILDYGFYHCHLQRFLEYFRCNQLLILLYTDIRMRPRLTIRNAYRFLDVEETYLSPRLDMRPQRGVYSPLRLRLHRFLNARRFRFNVERTRIYPRERLSRWENLLIRAVTWTDRKLFVHLIADAKPSLSFSLKRRLYELYREDVEALEQYLCRDLSHWKPASVRP